PKAAARKAGEHAAVAPGPRVLSPDWGERGERARSYDLQHIGFKIDFDLAKRRIRGEATNVVAPFADGLREIELDAQELTIQAAVVDGRPAHFTVGKDTV